jgi:putative hemolysin
MPTRQLARHVTYATSARSRPGRFLVRVLENAGGRLALIRRARGYEAELAQGRDFWEVMSRRYRIELEVMSGTLESLPRQGPLVVVANHPYGLLDGLTLGRILSERRAGDFRIMAHSVFEGAPELRRILLPIDFSETREAMARNLATRARALDYLAGGGAIGLFPGGTVSTAPTPFGPPLDPLWRSFTAKLAARPDTAVVPIFFEGANSRLFQVASHLHYALRLGLLIPEFRARVGTLVRLAVGEPIPRAELDAFGRDARSLMSFLRQRTYALSPHPLPSHRLGYEFEPRYREAMVARRDDAPGPAPEPVRGL